ncbi:MAG: ComF family protein [Planctomycetota bacterium]|nr:ComF family protein [Planctomycetota bacterium]
MHPHRFARWRRLGRELIDASLDLTLPRACPACGGAERDLCSVCRAALQRRPAPGCARCGDAAGPSGRCGASHARLRGLRQLVAPMQFAGAGGGLVRRFKLAGDVAAGKWLAREMADHWRVAGRATRPTLVPVPLHRRRLRQRGFDQARWLALALGRRLRLPVAPRALARARATLPQGHVRLRSRAQNVRGAFVVRRPELVRGRQVLLIDDVFTTGATARACAEQLQAAGATAVSLLVACRS